jgi:hypothetical protein
VTQTSIATSADYADALLVARRGKHVLFLLLMLMLLFQIALFFIARYTNAIVPASPAPTTKAAVVNELLSYLASGTTFFSMILPILLCFVLLLIVNIMLVGRLLGLARVTSAFLWCLVLVLLMFPYQTFFGGTNEPLDFRLPGMVFTWDELVTYAKFPTDRWAFAFMKWTRFLVMPLLALVLLAVVQIKSNRGLRQSLGEAVPELDRTV